MRAALLTKGNHMNSTEATALAILTARRGAGLKASELAARMSEILGRHVGVTTISRLERAGHPVPIDQLHAIAEATGWDVGWLAAPTFPVSIEGPGGRRATVGAGATSGPLFDLAA